MRCRAVGLVCDTRHAARTRHRSRIRRKTRSHTARRNPHRHRARSHVVRLWRYQLRSRKKHAHRKGGPAESCAGSRPAIRLSGPSRQHSARNHLRRVLVDQEPPLALSSPSRGDRHRHHRRTSRTTRAARSLKYSRVLQYLNIVGMRSFIRLISKTTRRVHELRPNQAVPDPVTIDRLRIEQMLPHRVVGSHNIHGVKVGLEIRYVLHVRRKQIRSPRQALMIDQQAEGRRLR